VLGVVVGKKLAGDVQTANSPDLLSALDANAQALKEVQTTFQDELTRKAAAEPAPAPAKPAAAKPAPAKPTATTTAAATPAAPAEKPAPVEKPVPAEKPAPAAEPTPALHSADEELAALAAVKRPQAPAPTPVAAAEKPAPAPKPAPREVEEAPVPTRTATPASGNLKDAIARAAQRPAEAVPGGAFTLQLSAFQTRDEADRFVARLRDRGYAPYIVAAEVANKGTWYRVRMGSFPSRDAASRYLSDFKRETQLDAFVAGAN
jgi:cell division protein FtsN